MSEAVAAEETLRRWRAEPYTFVRQIFDEPVEPDEWQDEGLEAIGNPDITNYAVRANKGPGKTAWLSWVIYWFLTCFKDSNITATAITGENLRDNLWKELALWKSRSKILSKTFVWTKERIFAADKAHEASWWCSARKWAKDADPEQQANTLAGLHAKYVMAVVDEAGGVPQGVVDAAEGILANLGVDGGLAKVVLTGNPTHVEGPLYRAFELEPEDWWRLHLTADPMFKSMARYHQQGSISRFTNRVAQKYVAKLIKRYGRNSPVVLVNALGEFPIGVSDAIITLQQYRNAVVAYQTPAREAVPNVLGVDIARLGSNESVVAKRRGRHLEGFESWVGHRTDYSADRIEEIFDSGPWSEVRIDDVGAGGGVTDQLLKKSRLREERGDLPIPVVPVDVGSTFGMTDEDKTKHLNLRSILYHDLQRVFVSEEICVHPEIENTTSLMEEGSTLLIEWTEQRNKRKIESKSKYKKRTGKSPDYLDATMLAWADRVCGPIYADVKSEPPPEPVHPTQLMPMHRPRVRLLDRRNPRAYPMG